MTLWQSIVLGVVQGLGEFLPISSSAHLVIVPWLGGFPDPGLTFDVALHFGTLLALLTYFYRDWINLIQGAFRSLGREKKTEKQQETLFWQLVLASIPGAVIGYLLEHQAETLFRTPLLTALMMTLMGLVLWRVDHSARKNKTLNNLGFLDSFWIGLSQALAIIPGVSRSGITITTGLARGLDRANAARFSFLLATPITAGACLLKAKDFISSGVTQEALIGMSVSFVVGFLSIKYMLRYVQKYSYRVFVAYRFVFSMVIVVVHFLRG